MLGILTFVSGHVFAGATAGKESPGVSGNSAHYINVTQADGLFVKEPLIVCDAFDARTAAENSRRIKAIMASDKISERCRIHFPAGIYYFDGAAEGWEASIQTTHKFQSITGGGHCHTKASRNAGSKASKKSPGILVALSRTFLCAIRTGLHSAFRT